MLQVRNLNLNLFIIVKCDPLSKKLALLTDPAKLRLLHQRVTGELAQYHTEL